MSGGSEKTTTTSSNEPWSGAQDSLKTNMALADKIGPSSFMPYSGSTVVPMASQTTQSLNMLEDVANNNANGRGVSGQYQNTINNGGMFGGQRSAAATTNAFANGAGAQSTSVPMSFANGFGRQSAAVPTSFANGAGAQSQTPFSNIASQAQGPSFSQRNLGGFASGDMIGKSNPYFEDALRIATDRTADSVNLGASSMGRYGSGAHTQTLARELGDMQTTARAGQVNSDIDRMMNANTMIDGQRMAGLGMGLNASQAAANVGFQNNQQRLSAANQAANVGFQNNQQRLSAANQAANVGFQNNQQRLGAAGDMFNMGQQAFQNLGAAYQGQMAPAQTLAGIGASYEDLMGRQINDEIRKFEGAQKAPLSAIEWRNAIASGNGALGGSSSSTSQAPGQNPFASALGYGMTGLGALGSFA